MKVVSDLLRDVPIPEMIPVRQIFDDSHIAPEDIPDRIRAALARPGIAGAIRPGMRIAVTCGSRGIRNYAAMTRTIVDTLRDRGAEPFIVAAMGSHGGASSQGQRQILADYGITETAMGCPVLTDMDTVVVGESPRHHRPVHVDKNAAGADGILLFNRIKPHTSFRGKWESGLMKMMAIGLGKQFGADDIHAQNPAIMHELVEDCGRTILENCPVIGGIAVIENAYDDTWLIEGLDRQGILDREPELLKLAYPKLARLLFSGCDVLIVDRIGKNISGDGMDPNVTGRFATRYVSGSGICPEKIAVLDLTDETHGNAQGMGFADAVSRRLYDKMVMEMTYPTGVTNTFLGLFKLPMVMDNDRECIQLVLHACPEAPDPRNLRVIRIPDTAHLEFIQISPSLLAEAQTDPRLEVLGAAAPMTFDAAGNLF